MQCADARREVPASTLAVACMDAPWCGTRAALRAEEQFSSMSLPYRRWLVLLLPALATAVAAGWTYSGFRYTGWFTDALDYLWLADFFRESFVGSPSSEAVTAFQTTRFPPMLSLLIAAAGGGSDALIPVGLLMFALFVGCTALATAWARREVGGVLVPMLCGLAVAISPGWFLLQQSSPVSEPLMLALVLLALLLAGQGPMSRGRALALALVAGTVPLARSIGIALVLPVALRLCTERSLGRSRWLFALVALLPFAAWSALRASLPSADSYTDSLDIETVLHAFGGIGGWLLGQPLRMIEGAAGAFAIEPGPAALTLAGIVAVLSLGAAALHWRRLDAQFLMLYCGIVLVWPFPAEASRFMVPLAPVALVLAARGVAMWLPGDGAGPAAQAARALGVMAALAILASIPDAVRSAQHALRAVDPQLEPFKRTAAYFMSPDERTADHSLEFAARLVSAMQVLPEYVPAGACVYSITPQMTYYYGGVRAAPVPRGLATPLAARERLTRCRFLLAMSAPSAQHAETPMYPATLIADEIDPLFISYMDVDGRRVPAVGLFDLAGIQRLK